MCNDFFDDIDGYEDSMFDPSNDFEEDLTGEYCMSDEAFREESADSLGDQNKEEQQFDILDALIIGSMIAGCAYKKEEDEKKRKDQRNTSNLHD